jgi:hypothetical protein
MSALGHICAAKSDVRFAPNSDRKSVFPHKVMSALPLKADMCGATSADPINRQLGNANEWNLLLNQFHALVRKGSDSSEVIFDAQFRHRFSRVIDQAAGANWRRWDDREQ